MNQCTAVYNSCALLESSISLTPPRRGLCDLSASFAMTDMSTQPPANCLTKLPVELQIMIFEKIRILDVTRENFAISQACLALTCRSLYRVWRRYLPAEHLSPPRLVRLNFFTPTHSHYLLHLLQQCGHLLMCIICQKDRALLA